ncbi:MAG: glycoside hydrolase family 3 protein [Rudaea sp.]
MHLTRRQFLAVSGHALVLALLAGCGPASKPTAVPPMTIPTAAAPAPTAPPAPATATSTPSPTASVAPTSGAADLENKIGQMLMIGFRGATVDDSSPIIQDIRSRNLGSVVLFDFDVDTATPGRNIQSPSQLRALTAALVESATSPLLVAIDQEGGQVARLKPSNGFPATLSEQDLGRLKDIGKTLQNAETIGKMLTESGINMDLAPVVDLNTNPDNPIIGKLGRSFSADPVVVARNAEAEIKGLHKYRVLSTLKHFPGHGSSRTDSHLGFVDVTDTWSPPELEPYRQLIAAGVCDAVMTAHIFNAKLDADYPATLSNAIITGILRNELQWDGVVISDDMQMGAITQHYGLDSAIEKAIEAGVDILAFGNNLPGSYDPNIAEKAIAIIKGLVNDGKISSSRIDQSLRRITALKARLP